MLVIVETHLVGKNTINIQGYKRITLRSRKCNGGGILIAAKDDTNFKMITLDINQDHEQLWVQINTPQGIFRMCAAYGLHESRSSPSEIESWHYELEKKYAEFGDVPTIILGDMNAHMGNDIQGIEGNAPETNTNGNFLRQFIDRRQLVLNNNMPNCTGKFTRVDPNGKHSILDLVITNQLMNNSLETMKVDEERIWTLTRYEKVNGTPTETPSDHNPIIITINYKRTTTQHKTTIWNFKSEEALHKFKEKTSSVKVKENWLEDGNPDEKYHKWFSQLKSILYSCFTKVSIKKGISNSIIQKKIQFKREIRKAIHNLNKNGIYDGVVIKTFNDKIADIIKEIDEECQNELSTRIEKKMNDIIEGKVKKDEIWSVRKKATQQYDQQLALRDEDGSLLTETDAIQERYLNYYVDLLKPRKPENDILDVKSEIEKTFHLYMEVKSHDQEPLNQPFTSKELDKVIKNLKVNKCPGEDGIPNEIIKSISGNYRQSLLNMYNFMWTKEKIPNSLLKVNIKSLYKGKGPTADLKNHRGIFISNTIFKVYEGLINERMSPVIEDKGYTSSQIGGRENHGIADHILVIRSILDNYNYLNKPLYIEFIDLIKAFDKMILKNVLNDLWNAEVRGRIWRNIYHINKKAILKIKTPMGLTEECEIGETLKQGSVLASSLAALHTDSVNRLFNHRENGVIYGDMKLNQLLFQDDILKIEDSAEKLNNANHVYTWFGKINSMKFHEEKSMFMTNSKNSTNIQLSNNNLNQAENYKYLADFITPTGSLQYTIKERKNQILGITAELSTIISLIDQQGLHILATKRYHQAIILPKLLTNAEAWSPTPIEMKELEIVQNITLKRLMRLPQGTPSKGLLNELGLWSIKNIILQKKLMYLHKLINYKQENLARKVFMTQISQPGKTWWSAIKEEAEVAKIKLDLEELQKISKNQWKKIVNESIQKVQSREFQEWSLTSKKCHNLKPQQKCHTYLQDLNKEDAMTILKERLKITPVKSYYKNMYGDQLCRICKSQIETTKHLIKCSQQKEATPEILENFDQQILEVESQNKEQLRLLAQLINSSLSIASALDAAALPHGCDFNEDQAIN